MMLAVATSERVAGERRSHLVRVLNENVLAVRLLHAHVRHRPYDTPAVCKRDI